MAQLKEVVEGIESCSAGPEELFVLRPHSAAIFYTICPISVFQEIYKDRKKFSKQVFEVASSDLVNMGITVVSYTLKDIRDDEVINRREKSD